jgi:hypothetical protein
VGGSAPGMWGGKNLSMVQYVLKHSAACTLMNKLRLNSRRQVFKRYGKSLRIERKTSLGGGGGEAAAELNLGAPPRPAGPRGVRPNLRVHYLVESRMQGNLHVRFGGEG